MYTHAQRSPLLDRERRRKTERLVIHFPKAAHKNFSNFLSSTKKLLDARAQLFCNALRGLFAAGGVGFEPTTTGLGGPNSRSVIDYATVKQDFEVWLRSRSLTDDYVKGILSDLRRFGCPLRLPIDVAKMFQSLSVGQKHGLIRAVRNLLNFYEAQGFAEKAWLDLLRKNIPRDEVGFDINVPVEEQIVGSLKQLSSDGGHAVYFAIYNLILDSGLRVIEAVRLIEDLDHVQIEKVNGFYVATLGMMRKVKLAYYAFFTEYTMELLRKLPYTIGYEAARKLKAKPISSEVIAGLVPNATLVKVLGGGHNFSVEMRGEFNREVLNFLKN